MGGSYTLSGRAGVDGLTELHELVEAIARDQPGPPRAELTMMETAIIEILGNVVEHGTPPGGIGYSFTLEIGPDKLVGVLLEDGDPVPMRAKGPDDDGELAESGRGLALARALLSELRYERRGETNAWILTRALFGPDDDAPAAS